MNLDLSEYHLYVNAYASYAFPKKARNQSNEEGSVKTSYQSELKKRQKACPFSN
jgi:hypothetical protein